MFVLDYLPPQYLAPGPSKSVMVFTAGWAMKFVPLLGRALKEMALDGHSDLKLENFAIGRTNIDPKTHKWHSIIHNDKEQGTKASSFMVTNVDSGEQASGSSYPYQRVQIAVQ